MMNRNKRISLCGTVMFILLKCLLGHDRETSSFVFVVISDWSEVLGISPKDLYLMNRKIAAQVR